MLVLVFSWGGVRKAQQFVRILASNNRILRWIEHFSLEDGLRFNEGQTSWTATRTGGIFHVQGKQFVDFIIRGLLEVVNAGLEVKGSLRLRPTRRPDIVKRAMDFVSSQLDDGLSSDDVAQALGVSNGVLPIRQCQSV